jgi:hypothetical protein
LEQLVAELSALLPPGPGRVGVVAVDGHSASGKTTLAERLAAALPLAAVPHTDDLAWHHSVFDWRELLAEGCSSRCAPVTRSRTGRRRGWSGVVTGPSRCRAAPRYS